MHLLPGAFMLATSLVLVSAIEHMNSVHEWKFIDYTWNSEAEKEEAIKAGRYSFGAVLPMDVDKSIDGRIFITLMGRRGVPATLGVVSELMGPSGPLIRPYPDWSYFKPDNCDSILNVYRIAIDECNRLWVLDTGYLENEEKKCPAKLLAFDLNNNTLIHKIIIPNNIARDSNGETLLANPIVETDGPNCKNTTVFMAETGSGAIVVWNGIRTFRLESPVFKAIPGAERVTVGEHSMDIRGAVQGMDVSPRLFPGEPRFLYFRPLASRDLYAAGAEVLKRSTFGDTIKFFGVRNILSSQALGIAFSADGTLFFGMTKETGIACWNRYRYFNTSNIVMVAQDSDRLQFPNGVKVIPPSPHNNEEELLVLSNRFIPFQQGKLSIVDVNFRVLSSPVRKLVAGTKCAIPRVNLEALDKIDVRLIIPN